MKTHPHHHRLRFTIVHSFVGGIAWAVGLTLGVSLLVYLLGFVATALGGIPVIGEWLAQVIKATLDALQRK